MKAKAILFVASVLLVGCQATHTTGSQQQANSLSVAGQQTSISDEYGSGSEQNDLIITASNQDLWGVIRSGLNMQIPDNQRVRQQKQFYLGKKSYLQNVLRRADPYLYWIVEQLEKRRMPMELTLLPIVESAFNPHAKSVANAAGLWQIIPSTGTNYGLKQNRSYDGRLDVVASTNAALDMLQYLNNMFNGDWLLTIAAYNSGEGRVLNAIKANKARGKPIDYWSLNLPKETEQYVPRLLALTDIFKHSKRYGLQLPKTDRGRALVQVPLNAPVDIPQIVQLTGIDPVKLKAFNAGIRGSIYGLNEPLRVMIPRQHAAQLRQALNEGNFVPVSQALIADNRASIERSNKTSSIGHSYKVRKGDSLSLIAKRAGVKVKDLQNWNHLRGIQIKTGQTLLVKKSSRTVSSLARNSITYKVRRGDSLYSIAKRHGVKIADLKRWNQITDKLRPGDQLTLYVKNRTAPDS